MKEKFLYFILALILVIGLIYQQYLIRTASPSKEDILIEKVTEIERKLDIISNRKDSIRTVIDSTHVKIVTNEKHYQEMVNTIITQPIDSNKEYISNYIRFYRSKRDSFNMR